MKKLLFISFILTLSSLVQAETTVKLEGVHNCCKSCTNGIIKAGVGLKDVAIVADGETVTITSKTKANAKKAVEAVLEAGYYGKPSDASFAEPARAKPEKKLAKATVTGAHLCCQKCVNAMTEAVKAVPGVTSYEIVSKEKTFTVQGEFTEADLIASMNKAGFHGSVK